jgi:hypothetical protein
MFLGVLCRRRIDALPSSREANHQARIRLGGGCSCIVAAREVAEQATMSPGDFASGVGGAKQQGCHGERSPEVLVIARRLG